MSNSGTSKTNLIEYRVKKSPSVNPALHPKEKFELFSIPAYPDKQPEVVSGTEIGSSKKLVSPNTVLFGKINPRINRVWTVPNSSGHRQIASTEWIQFQPLPRMLPKYLQYFLMQHSIRDFVASNVSGVGGSLTRAQMTVLDHVEVPLPDLPEQQAIVDEIETQFARLDDAESALRRAEVRLGKLTESHLQFFSHYSSDGEGNTIPSKTLGDLASIQGGIQKQPKRAPVNNSYPFLRVANVLKGRLDLDEIHEVELFGNELDRLKLHKGDLLIVEGNGSPAQIGRMAVWDGSIYNCVHQNHIIRARPKDCVLPEYIEMFWNSPTGRKAILNLAASTSGLYTLSVAKVSGIRIPLPCLQQQRNLISDYQLLTSRVSGVKKSLDATRIHVNQLRQSILRKAFGGTHGQ